MKTTRKECMAKPSPLVKLQCRRATVYRQSWGPQAYRTHESLIPVSLTSPDISVLERTRGNVKPCPMLVIRLRQAISPFLAKGNPGFGSL